MIDVVRSQAQAQEPWSLMWMRFQRRTVAMGLATLACLFALARCGLGAPAFIDVWASNRSESSLVIALEYGGESPTSIRYLVGPNSQGYLMQGHDGRPATILVADSDGRQLASFVVDSDAFGVVVDADQRIEARRGLEGIPFEDGVEYPRATPAP